MDLKALKTLPRFEQVFVNAPEDTDDAAFNRKLFMARRRAEKILADDPVFYVPSLSNKTIVYKGLLLATQIYDMHRLAHEVSGGLIVALPGST